MNQLFESADRYLKESDWRDIAILKFCLCSMGVLMGAHIPAKNRDRACGFAAGVFAVTYVVLMNKFLKILFDKNE